jgi:glycosyltransferase involved in cell wall biosynthesis
MRVSVVIATYNRSQLLPRLFSALNNQTLPDDELEVVIVDDGSTDDTPRILAELARSSRVPVRLLRQSPNAGPAKARNRGANEAKGGIIAFTDDDCVPTADWLRAGLELAGRGKIVVGRTVPSHAPCRYATPASCQPAMSSTRARISSLAVDLTRASAEQPAKTPTSDCVWLRKAPGLYSAAMPVFITRYAQVHSAPLFARHGASGLTCLWWSGCTRQYANTYPENSSGKPATFTHGAGWLAFSASHSAPGLPSRCCPGPCSEAKFRRLRADEPLLC